MESPLLDDITRFIERNFGAGERQQAAALVTDARLHNGELADPRLQRCALVASDGSLDRLKYYVKLLKIDFRDVIAAAEYDSRQGELIKARDLSRPID